MPKYVHMFDESKNPNTEEAQFVLGNKGAQLAEMTNAGLRVPYGFTITTEACKQYYALGKKWPKGLESEIKKAVAKLERKMGKKFGSTKNPLFVSVRSGSYVSMPGMMDTVLNLGMNDKTVEGFSSLTKNERAALDSYRRFINMFGDVVMNVPHSKFEEIIHAKKEEKGVKFDPELTDEDLKGVVEGYKALVKSEKGISFPDEPIKQLEMGINAVFESWNSPRAISYRRINNLRSDAGTAVNVQAMVFGNMGDDSGTGVSFTRNPATGAKEHYGEFLVNAQGEDVVAGIRTPHPIDHMKKTHPKMYAELIKIYEKLEKHYREMQDFEFTFEKGKLYMLQTRNGKCTAQAAVKIAVDMAKEGLITKEEAVMRVKPAQLDQLLHKQLDSESKKKSSVLAKGLAASPGAAVGKIVFTAERATELVDLGEKVILVRMETSPEDIEGMHAAQGILTARGGVTCIAGETKILTNKGFFCAKELFELISNQEKFSVLSFENSSMKTKWKPIIATGKRSSLAIKVNVSQTGRAKGNSITLTPDHKMILIENRSLAKKELEKVLAEKEMVSIIDKIPTDNPVCDPDYAYLAGAIFTDGSLSLSKRRGRVTFTQKNIPQKHDFISRVNRIFFEKFGLAMRESVKHTIGNYRGREIRGYASDFISHRKMPAQALLVTKNDTVNWVLSLDEVSTLNFLAGVIDGDGAISDQRLQVYIGKPHLLPAVVVACLKLGIVPQVTKNRAISNVQIVEGVERILQFTSRVKFSKRAKTYQSKLFSLKQMFEDVKHQVDFYGSIKPAIKENKMLSREKIIEYVLGAKKSAALGQGLQKQLRRILDSDLRNYRVSKESDVGEIEVFNFEVDAGTEIDKNFVAFTEKYTPILISNSHAAVVARGMGKCCVAGCDEIRVSESAMTMAVPKKNLVLREGDFISLDGGTGEVFEGQIALVEPTLSGDFGTLMNWADSYRKIGVRTNADTPHDAKVAREFGAEGIGLCRTEHMFFEGERIKAVREMIIARDETGRRKALDKLLPFQRSDFEGIFKEMDGFPVIIRLLDPPLHEFLPKEEEDMAMLAQEMNLSLEKVKEISASLHEFNPMLGHRGCRLGITYPEITEMQATAIFEAALNVSEKGIKPIPEIEIPLVGDVREFADQKAIIEAVAQRLNIKGKIKYKIGTMFEVPRACVKAGELAKVVDFISFGTNDLTQTTLGFSRDDAGKFIQVYLEKGILETDPFQTIDQNGVGKLMVLAVDAARASKPGIDIGICGEHGGDAASVEFCHRIGLSNVSCSPYRVPIARLAAAQAALKDKKGKSKGKKKR